jgi:hypothetical protein
MRVHGNGVTVISKLAWATGKRPARFLDVAKPFDTTLSTVTKALSL